MQPEHDVVGEILAAMAKKPERKAPPQAPQREVEAQRREHMRPTKEKVFPDPITEKLKILLMPSKKKGLPRTEIECSIGTYSQDRRGSVFHPGMTSLSAFEHAKKVLSDLVENKELELQTYDSLVEMMDYNDAPEALRWVRRITTLDVVDQPPRYEKKFRSRDFTIDNPVWGYRITSSTEEEVGISPEDEARFIPNVSRRIRRYAYRVISTNSEYYGVRFDLSAVEESHRHRPGSEEREEGREDSWTISKYEAEVERIEASISVKSFEAACLYLMSLSQGLDRVGDEDSLVTLEEKRRIVAGHNQLLSERSQQEQRKPNPYRLMTGYWNKPKNIKINSLVNPLFNAAVTVKLNGVRKFLYITTAGTYLVFAPYDITRVGDGIEEYAGSLVDGEYLEQEKTFYAFDIVAYNGNDVRSRDLLSRYDLVTKIGQLKDGAKLSIKIAVKEYFGPGFKNNAVPDGGYTDDKKGDVIYANATKAYEIFASDRKRYDGIIFQPYIFYRNNYTYKWKPVEELTIDFLVEKEFDGLGFPDTDMYWLVVSGSSEGGRGSPRDLIFNGSREHPITGGAKMIVPGGRFRDSYVSGRIIECRYNYEKSSFEPLRYREDRDRPNNVVTASDVWNDIQEPLTEETITGNSAIIMRRFHNMVKKTLISHTLKPGEVVLDIGPGRGGDLKKWKDAKLGKVYGVEPNEDNRNIMLERLDTFVGAPPVILIPTGIEDTEAVAKAIGTTKIDAITAFFSLTFLSQSEETFKGLINSIDRFLPENGLFFGAVFDGSRVRKILEEARVQQKTPDDDIVEYDPSHKVGDEVFRTFSIAQISKMDERVYGRKIEVSLNDPNSMVKKVEGDVIGAQTEFLFYFDHFANELAKKGIVLKDSYYLDKDVPLSISPYEDKTFESKQIFSLLPPDSKVFSSLNRVFVFERKKRVVRLALPPAEVDHLKSFAAGSSLYDDKLYYIGVPLNPNNFLHAVFRAFSKEYYALDSDGREKFVTKFRLSLAKKITMESFLKLKVSQVLVRESKARVGSDKAEDDAFKRFKLKLLTKTDWVGRELIGDLVASTQGYNIVSLTPDARVIGASPSADGVKTIVLLEIDGTYSQTVVSFPLKEKPKMVFKKGDKLLDKLLP